MRRFSTVSEGNAFILQRGQKENCASFISCYGKSVAQQFSPVLDDMNSSMRSGLEKNIAIDLADSLCEGSTHGE